MELIKFLIIALLVTMATGQQALAETVTYTLSGSTESNGNVNFVATASGSATGTLNDCIADLAGKTLVPYISISVGDVNGDGSVTIADVPALVALILSDSPYDPVADVTALVNNIRQR